MEREPFDAGRYVARARRRADLSQRGLAARAGLSQSQIAAVESGARRITADALDSLLGLAGLRLAVVDEEGREVAPIASDAVRDNAGRRFPAHLDVRPPDEEPGERARSPRYDRAPARGWYHRREQRDRRDQRDRRGASPPEVRDHPTTAEVEYRRLARLYERTSWWPHRKAAIAQALGVDRSPLAD